MKSCVYVVETADGIGQLWPMYITTDEKTAILEFLRLRSMYSSSAEIGLVRFLLSDGNVEGAQYWDDYIMDFDDDVCPIRFDEMFGLRGNELRSSDET